VDGRKKIKTQRCGVILFIISQRLGVSALKTAFPSIEIKSALKTPRRKIPFFTARREIFSEAV
jgi:hypothetical protein